MQLLYLSLALTLDAIPLAPAATTVVSGPYLQLATPTSMVVRWRTDTTEPSSVRYGLAADQLTQTAKAEGVGSEHVVQLAKLQPATRYFYVPITGNDKPAKPGAEEQLVLVAGKAVTVIADAAKTIKGLVKVAANLHRTEQAVGGGHSIRTGIIGPDFGSLDPWASLIAQLEPCAQCRGRCIPRGLRSRQSALSGQLPCNS
jgi:hypothetical protein